MQIILKDLPSSLKCVAFCYLHLLATASKSLLLPFIFHTSSYFTRSKHAPSSTLCFRSFMLSFLSLSSFQGKKKKKKLLICACFVNKSYSEITGFLGNVINKHGRKTRVINLNGNKHKQAAKQRSHSATQSPPKQPAWSVIKEGHYKCIQSPHFCQLSPFCLTI